VAAVGACAWPTTGPTVAAPRRPMPMTTLREKSANEHSKIYEKIQMNTPKFMKKKHVNTPKKCK
jgi:hypothetical protein